MPLSAEESADEWQRVYPDMSREFAFKKGRTSKRVIETPEHRWKRMRDWVASQIKEATETKCKEKL